MDKSLDRKLANLRINPQSTKDFILCDAKDSDLGAGLSAPGKDISGRLRTLAQYREQIAQVAQQGLVDISLMSASSAEILVIQQRMFDQLAVTPAVRANDTTDVHTMTGYTIASEPSRPFSTTTIDQIQSGKVNPTADERARGVNLGLYSITLNNRIDLDLLTLEAYKSFRIEAETKGFRHFLEVFDPNAWQGPALEDVGRFVNDAIARTLGGVPSAGKPLFLKIAYHGPRALEDLVTYDPTLIVGIMGGSSGTTFNAFHLLEEARKYGARAAFYGRKINNSEHQLTFVRYLRLIADGQIIAADAVKAYHADLAGLQIKPYRALKDDLELTVTYNNYG